MRPKEARGQALPGYAPASGWMAPRIEVMILARDSTIRTLAGPDTKSVLVGMPYLEERVDTVETDSTEIKSRLGVLGRSVGNIEKNTAVMRDEIAELKTGQIEIRDLLARVVVRLEGVPGRTVQIRARSAVGDRAGARTADRLGDGRSVRTASGCPGV
ncbi:hypothetical protein [Streptosporangium sp. NPDC000509]|uniref:hypothetical protein n=1 Tax=Streptosporangium sp. NPDC000509 TaxID=3366186 RepID=UPI0036787212